MNIKTYTKQNFVFGEVRKPGAKTVSAQITSGRLGVNSPDLIATGLIYSDLLLSGSGEFSREEFELKLHELGSTISISASGTKVTISLVALDNKLKSTLDLLKLALYSPVFKPAEYKRAKQSLKNLLKEEKENARAISIANFKNSIFSSNSRHYVHDPETLIKATEKISLSEIKKFHQLFLDSLWTTTVGGSDSSVDLFIKFIEKAKTNTRVNLSTDTKAVFTGLQSRQVITHEVKTKQNIEFSIGGYLPLTLRDKELPAFIFGLSVLAKWGGFSGRLMSTVREKEGLTYMIYGKTAGITVDEAGYWCISTFFSPKDSVKGLTSTIREIFKIQKTGISQSEWERFKVILKTGETLVFDSLKSTVNLVHEKLVAGMSWDEYQNFKNDLLSCSRSEINSVLKEYLDSENLTISASGPIESVKTELLQFAKLA